MTPLRLFILAVLFYIGWRMLRSFFVKKHPPVVDSDCIPQDELVEDPVCHVLVPKKQALRLRRDGETYYFCSEKCCDQFAGEPGKGEL